MKIDMSALEGEATAVSVRPGPRASVGGRLRPPLLPIPPHAGPRLTPLPPGNFSSPASDVYYIKRKCFARRGTCRGTYKEIFPPPGHMEDELAAWLDAVEVTD